MNILYTNIHKEDGGGQTTYILSLVKNNPHTTYVACPAGSLLHTTLRDQGYTNHIPINFPGKPRDYKEIIRNTLALRRAIIEHDIDIVHTNGSPDNRMALYASLITLKKFRVVFTKHNVIKFNNAVSRLRLNLFNDAVIFVGNFLNLLGLKQNSPKYHIILNGIDTEHWKKKEPIKTGNTLTLISNAGASRHKGWHHMMEAISGLSKEEKERLSVVMLARHEPDMAKELEEAEHICNFSRPGFFSDIRPYLEKADIGFVLSYKEAYNFASREMLAMGIPVIMSDYPTLKVAVDPSCGWVTKLKDPDSIREVLRKILALSPEEINAMKVAARKKAVENCDIKLMIEQTLNVYDTLMKK